MWPTKLLMSSNLDSTCRNKESYWMGRITKQYMINYRRKRGIVRLSNRILSPKYPDRWEIQSRKAQWNSHQPDKVLIGVNLSREANYISNTCGLCKKIDKNIYQPLRGAIGTTNKSFNTNLDMWTIFKDSNSQGQLLIMIRPFREIGNEILKIKVLMMWKKGKEFCLNLSNWKKKHSDKNNLSAIIHMESLKKSLKRKDKSIIT